MGIFTFNNLLPAVKTNGLSESFLPPMILNMSITASGIILFVLLARLALKKAPKVFSYALWTVVLFRLLCPVSITTDFSLLGLFETPAMENTQHTTAVEYIPYDVVHTPNLEVQLPLPPAINDAVNSTLPQEHAALGADPLEGEFAIGSLIWLLGIAVMAIYSAVSYIRLRHKLVGSVLLRDNIYLADGIGSPFVMGFFRPKIYLPSALSEQEQSYIILHEQHHIRRGDHIIKALAFIALCIHWFNPLVWIAFVLSSKDMEMSCDEAVVKKLGEGIRADYSASLLSLATGRRIIAGTPLAFGEGDTKSRIKNMLNWKAPKTWLVITSAVAVVVAVVLCGTNANNQSKVKTQQAENGLEVALTLKSPIRSYAIYEEIYQDGRLISGKPKMVKNAERDDWGDMPYKHTFTLRVQPGHLPDGGFSGELTSWYEENGVGVERKTMLPQNAYTGSAQIVGLGNLEATLSKESHSIAAGDDVVLLSVVMSTEPNGEVCVYRNGWSLTRGNDTVVQYRLVTSTNDEPFTDMPLDLAQTLYDLRVETLNDRDDPGAQEAIRTLLNTMGASEFGPYELEYYDMTRADYVSVLNNGNRYWPGGTEDTPPYKKTALAVRFTAPLEPGEARPLSKSCAELLLALVPDLDEVHIANKRTNNPTRYSYVITDEDGKETAKYLGAKSIEELGQSAKGLRALMDFNDFENSIPKMSNSGVSGSTGELVAFLKTLNREDIGHMDWVMGENITIKDVVAAINSAASSLVQHKPMNFGTTKFWSLNLLVGDPNATGWSGKDGIHLYAGLEENIVEISTGENLPQGPIWVESKELYSIVRHSSDYEEIVDEAAFARFKTILTDQMDRTLVSMSENLGDYTSYELTRFNRIWRYENPGGSIVELYDFNYALLPETIESIVWAGGMYLDSQLRVQGFNHGGPLAVSYVGNRMTGTAFMANDFNYDPQDVENEAWAKEMINSALGIHPEPTPAVPPTEADVHAAIMTNFDTVMITYGNGNVENADYQTEAHGHLATEQPDAETYTFYSDVLYAAYRFQDGKYDCVDSAKVPTKLTYFWRDGEWKLEEFWTPDRTTNLGNVFPAKAMEILNRANEPSYYTILPKACDENAVRYYTEQTGSVPSKTFIPEDVEFFGQELTVSLDELTYEERLAWVQAGPDYQQTHFTSLGQYAEENGCLAYLGQWVGTPHMNQYGLDIRFVDGTTAHLPLPNDGGLGVVPPDTMFFQNGKFIYEMTFPTTEVTNEGETLVHIKGTYHYEVDLAAKTVSLTVLQ